MNKARFLTVVLSIVAVTAMVGSVLAADAPKEDALTCTICKKAFETDEEAAAHAKMHEQGMNAKKMKPTKPSTMR